MAALTDINFITGYAEFAIEDASELELLPTTSSSGVGALAHIGTPNGTISEGSIAIEKDFTPHRLTANGWT